MKPLAPNDMIEEITGVRAMSIRDALESKKLRF
jgi:hypothetical protein